MSKAAHSRARGRPPIGDRPMSSAEQKRRSRAKLDQRGSREFTVRMSGATLQLVDAMATSAGWDRNRFIGYVLTEALVRLGDALFAELKARIDRGEPPVEALDKISRDKRISRD